MAKPTFVTPADIIGTAAPGPYTEDGRLDLTVPGAQAKVIVVGLSFKANTWVVKAGDKISVDITNCATFAHNFVSPDLGVPAANKINIGAAAPSTTVTFTAPTKPGKYMFWCSTQPPGALSHAERGMTGEVIVQ